MSTDTKHKQETFEALSALSSHGLPKIIAVLTHLDLIKSPAALKAQKKRLKNRFWTEVYDGAKMFYLSGVMNGRYPDREILNLGRYVKKTLLTSKTIPKTDRQWVFFCQVHLSSQIPASSVPKHPFLLPHRSIRRPNSTRNDSSKPYRRSNHRHLRIFAWCTPTTSFSVSFRSNPHPRIWRGRLFSWKNVGIAGSLSAADKG